MASEIKELWGDALSYIRSKIEETAFQTWFEGLEINAMNEDSITLIVPNRFHYEWLESKYRSLINNAVKSSFGKSLIVNYSVMITEKKADDIPKFTFGKFSFTYLKLSSINFQSVPFLIYSPLASLPSILTLIITVLNFFQ